VRQVRRRQGVGRRGVVLIPRGGGRVVLDPRLHEAG